MPVYVEKVKDKETGKIVDKLVGKDKRKQYYIRIYVEDEFGRTHQITRHNKKWIGRDGYREAERIAITLQNQTFFSKRKKVLTLKEAEEIYLESINGKVDDDTLDKKRTLLDHFCDTDSTNQVKTYPKENIKKITKEIYGKWQKEMKEKKYQHGKKWKSYSIKYLNKIHNEISRMLDYLIAEGYIQLNFAKQCGSIGSTKEIKISNINKTDEYEVIDYDEYLRLMDVSKDDKKYNTYFDLEFTRGPRPGEIRAFQVKDFNYEKKQLMVNHTMSKKNELKDPKTPSSKAPIDLNDEVNEKIYQLIEELKKRKDFNENWYIFNGPTPISMGSLKNAKKKYFKLANINKYLRPHDFRHSCATWLFSIGTPITVISKILRHANINETMKTYTHLLNKDYKDWLLKINDYGNDKFLEARPKTRPKYILAYKNPLFQKG